jgi:hypothetical protein
LAWIGVLGFDLILHGAILSSFYVQESSFLLPPLDSFRRIPFGYFSFLIATSFLVWLISKIDIQGWRRGLLLGGFVGAVIWVSLGLGMYSISTAPPNLLFGWVLGQTLEMAYAGAVIGEGLFAKRTRKLSIIVLLLTGVFILITVILQSIGLAQTVRVS